MEIRLMNEIEVKAGKRNQVWINVLPFGEFYDARYGKVVIDKKLADEMVQNFKKGIPHYEPPVNLSHDDSKGAYGRVIDLEVRADGLWALMELTDEGVEMVKSGKYRYVSAEFATDYTDKKTGNKVGAVFLGIGLTSRPAHPDVEPIRLSEKFKEAVIRLANMFKMAEPLDEDSPWSFDWAKDADEIINKLGWKGLAQACAYVDTKNFEKGESGYPEVKAAYKLPFAKMKNGKLTIFKRGVIAAMTALLGARGGVKIPNEDKKKVYDKLAKLYKKFDMEPPEFHLEEGDNMDDKVIKLEEEVKTLQEEVKTLQEELAKTKEEKMKLEEELKKRELEEWKEKWIREGVPPAVMEKFVKLAEKVDKKELEETLETFKKPLGQMASNDETGEWKRADEVAKAVYGGDA